MFTILYRPEKLQNAWPFYMYINPDTVSKKNKSLVEISPQGFSNWNDLHCKLIILKQNRL